MAHEVFISHSAKDKATADAVCHGLEAQGIRCWIAPRDVREGQAFAAEITRAIRSCKVLVLIFSGEADRSAHVRREVGSAMDEGATVIPFRLENVAAGDELEFWLQGVHWLDAVSPPMDQHIERLALAVKALLKVEQSVPDSAGGGSAAVMPPLSPLLPASPHPALGLSQ